MPGFSFVVPGELVQEKVPWAALWQHDLKEERVCCYFNSNKPLYPLVPER
jgi:hypothetical protein